MNRTTKIGSRHLRPVPQNTLHAHLSSAPTTHLSGQSLTIDRFTTMGLVIFTLAYMLPLLPTYLSFLHTVCFGVACPAGQLTLQAVQALKLAGLSIDIFVAYTPVLTLLALMMCWIVAAVIVWHKSDDWMALLVAVMLVLMGTSYVTHLLLQQPSPWQMLALLLDILTFGVFFLVFCLFPSGRFVPSWLRWMLVGWIIWGLITIAIHNVPGFYSFHLIGFIAGLIVIVSAQIYRYFRVSTMVERQQTKWVVWGASVAIASVVGVSMPEVFFPSIVQRSWLYCLLDAPALTLALILGSLSIGMAVLRTHLWYIDVLINRTLVYGLLTANLAFLYVGLVIALQFFLQRLFSHTNDVALSTLTRDLLAVVEETMQPAHISLWLNTPQKHTEEPRHLE
jgi:hypothetical protein